MCSKIKRWVSQSVSDKVTYWAVRWQLKNFWDPLFLFFCQNVFIVIAYSWQAMFEADIIHKSCWVRREPIGNQRCSRSPPRSSATQGWSNWVMIIVDKLYFDNHRSCHLVLFCKCIQIWNYSWQQRNGWKDGFKRVWIFIDQVFVDRLDGKFVLNIK